MIWPGHSIKQFLGSRAANVFKVQPKSFNSTDFLYNGGTTRRALSMAGPLTSLNSSSSTSRFYSKLGNEICSNYTLYKSNSIFCISVLTLWGKRLILYCGSYLPLSWWRTPRDCLALFQVSVIGVFGKW